MNLASPGQQASGRVSAIAETLRMAAASDACIRLITCSGAAVIVTPIRVMNGVLYARKVVARGQKTAPVFVSVEAISVIEILAENDPRNDHAATMTAPEDVRTRADEFGMILSHAASRGVTSQISMTSGATVIVTPTGVRDGILDAYRGDASARFGVRTVVVIEDISVIEHVLLPSRGA